MEANGCVVWRATPEGEATVIADLDWGYCSNLAFGREGAGWDPLSVYIATYNRVIRVEVGVPGRPR